MPLPKVSVILVNYNSLADLQTCLPALAAQKYPDCEVLIVDNASSDASLLYVESEFPGFTILRSPANLGYAGGNNLGCQAASGEYIAFLNPDTRVDPDWLVELVEALESRPRAGLATPKILLHDRPDRINTCGNEITLSGLTFCRGLEESKDAYPQLEQIAAVSGAAFLVRRSVLDQIGGFDERFFTYYEETDLSLRAMLAGYELYYVPSSIVYHRYAFRYSANKAFYQERNRYFALLKTLRWGTLLAMLPSLLVAEIVAWGYAVLHGPQHIANKFRTYIWLVVNFPQVLESRRQVQALRRVPDKDLLKHFGYRLNFTQTTTPGLAKALDLLVNPFLFLFSAFSRSIVAW